MLIDEVTGIERDYQDVAMQTGLSAFLIPLWPLEPFDFFDKSAFHSIYHLISWTIRAIQLITL
jgi:hypothetical protein